VSFEDTISIMLGRGVKGRGPLDPVEWKRVKARVAWMGETLAAWGEAQRQMHERCKASVDRVSEDEFNRIFDEEQAKVDAIRARIDAVVEHNRWPPELHWTL
jgi:hypothetical protein